MRRRAALRFGMGLVLTACSGGGTAPSSPSTPVPSIGRADVGGYELAYACRGEGQPTVVLEAGLGAAGTEEFFSFADRVAAVTRVCTYDRAGTGASDLRNEYEGLVTATLMARELHALLEAIGVEPPIVLVGHSYGGMPVRAFEGTYPDDVAGMVLVDASSEPEVPVYDRLDAGPWLDGADEIEIHATVQELRAAGVIGDVPLIVVTAEIIEDEWLATVPKLAAGAQMRLAGLSSNAIHVVAVGSGHFVHDEEPELVATAIRAVVEAARRGSSLPDCEEAFAGLNATCLDPGMPPELVPAE